MDKLRSRAGAHATDYRPLVFAVLACIVVLGIGGAIISLAEQKRAMRQRATADAIGAQHAYILQRQVDRSLSATFSLAAVLHESGTITNFDAVAAGLIARYGGITNLQLAPDGVVRQIYPLPGNERAIGHDLLNDPARQAEAQRAIAARALTVTGPLTLVQGGEGIIGRLPVFVNDGASGERFWGFTTALIGLPDLLEDSNLAQLEADGYRYELSRIDPNSGQRVIFARSGTPELQDPVAFPIELPNDRWTLSVAPRAGWTRSSSLQPEALLVLLLSMSAAAGAYTMLRQPEVLRREVALRTAVLATTNQQLAGEITERRQIEQALRGSEERFRRLFEYAADAIIVHDRRGRIVDVNQRLVDLLGYTREELLQFSIPDIDITSHRDEISPLWLSLQQGMAVTIEGIQRHKDGSLFPVEVRLGLFETGDEELILALCTDISERKQLEQQLAHQAFHDSLTGLPNRALFLDRLGHALPRGGRHSDTLAVLFLDLDGFKVINDSLGHENGDQLLIAVAARLQRCVRPEDTVVRLGGDEFTILLEMLDDAHDAIRVAERIREELSDPFVVGDHEFFITASIGIAVNRAEHGQPDDLLRDADTAMYRAKQAGKARYEMFDPSMNVTAIERLELETDLRHAIERGEFALHYQPIVDLATGQLAGLEALVRWEHSARGLISPDAFIPLAEETGLIVPLGRWVLEEACRQMRAWQVRHPATPPLIISVNLAARQFLLSDVVEHIAGVLRETGLPPASLQLEITESALMAEGLIVDGTLQALKVLGVSLVIDDFGTGYSSLGYLKHLPVNGLKIDKSFVAGLGRDIGDTAIVQAVITLAHTLGLSVTAEGVEEAEQSARLRELGCQLGQGYYFAKPMESAAADALITRRVWLSVDDRALPVNDLAALPGPRGWPALAVAPRIAGDQPRQRRRAGRSSRW